MAEETRPDPIDLLDDDQGEGGIGLERLIFFSDAVFAIAITLLVLDLHVPNIPSNRVSADLARSVIDLLPNVISYALSFGVIAVEWRAHHRMFRYIERYDERLLSLNLLLLLFVAFVPFPTSILGRYSGDPFAAGFYAASIALVGFNSFLIWWYSSAHHRLVRKDLDPLLIKFFTVRSLIPVVVFGSSIVWALISAGLAEYSWFLVIPLLGLTNRWYRRQLAVPNATAVRSDRKPHPEAASTEPVVDGRMPAESAEQHHHDRSGDTDHQQRDAKQHP